MRLRALAYLALAVWGALAPPPLVAGPVDQRMITDEEAPLWSGLGRLNLAGNRYCTATLIAPDQVLTSAHCLFHPATHHQTHVDEIRFVPGLRRDDFGAVVGVAKVALAAEYVYPGPVVQAETAPLDLALILLSRPLTPAEATPLAIADFPGPAARYDIAGYGRDRPLIPSLRADCGFVDRVAEVVALDCPVVPGLSGAPVVLSGGQAVVAVVSASLGPRVQGVAVTVTPVAPHLAMLRARLN